MANHKMTLVLMCLLWLASTVGAGAAPADSDSPAIIVLRGVLESKKASPPPGSGGTSANDRKVVVYVLTLPMPVPARGLALPGDSGDPRQGFQELQLVCDYPGYPECEAVLKRSVSHPIRVVGQTARAAEPAGQPPLMHVRLITVLQ
jgi:hypothetical protein